MEREAQKDIETQKRADARQDVLEENITAHMKISGSQDYAQSLILGFSNDPFYCWQCWFH